MFCCKLLTHTHTYAAFHSLSTTLQKTSAEHNDRTAVLPQKHFSLKGGSEAHAGASECSGQGSNLGSFQPPTRFSDHDSSKMALHNPFSRTSFWQDLGAMGEENNPNQNHPFDETFQTQTAGSGISTPWFYSRVFTSSTKPCFMLLGPKEAYKRPSKSTFYLIILVNIHFSPHTKMERRILSVNTLCIRLQSKQYAWKTLSNHPLSKT